MKASSAATTRGQCLLTLLVFLWQLHHDNGSFTGQDCVQNTTLNCELFVLAVVVSIVQEECRLLARLVASSNNGNMRKEGQHSRLT